LIPAPAGAAAQLAHSLNAMTADLLLRDTLDLKKGEWLLQNAANSNVGRYVIALAKLRGYKTANVVRRAGQAAGLTALGADVVVVDGPGLAEELVRATGGAEIGYGVDAVAGDATGRLAECLADGGTIFTYGLMSGEPCLVQPRILFQKDLRLRGYYMGRPLRKRTPEAQRNLFTDLVSLMADGTLVAEIAGTYPLRDVRSAVRHAAKTGAERVGKVLMAPNLD
jgi:NADPH:quinone reductase-like Zn-dependent oxidoreductase